MEKGTCEGRLTAHDFFKRLEVAKSYYTILKNINKFL